MNDFGVYVHIPFCTRRCDYCAFATWSDRAHLVDAYMGALSADIDRTVAAGALPSATSIFVGGGTPSLVPGVALMDVLSHIPHTADAEITVECNPETVTDELMATYVAGGVNRVSFGVQSLVPRVLEALGRDHDPGMVESAVRAARSAGIERLNLDLIYGGAGETVDEWRHTLQRVIELEPTHVSAYALTVEPGTPLADDPARHPDDDDQADKYLLADRLFSDAGYANYEISNWARPGEECRHNLLYWRQGDYLGFGCAAHSHRAGRRWWNVRTPDRYIDLVADDASVEASAELLDDEHRRIERLQLSLRTREGVPLASFDPGDLEVFDGLVEIEGDTVRLTTDGRLLANEVAVRIR